MAQTPLTNTLLPGDLLPPIALPDAAGEAVDLFHQSLAGLSCVLVLGRPRRGRRRRRPARPRWTRGSSWWRRSAPTAPPGARTRPGACSIRSAACSTPSACRKAAWR
ncbi:hypothetical protein [Teichococcus aestuarii]|uniref:hypothetical protein n=1 Tax=Teichococcus aestuarii TaxID=568898 RepID=UPI0036065655